MTSGSNNGISSPGQEQDTIKQRVFKFLDGLKLGNMTDDFSLVGEKNLANKFKISVEEFRTLIQEYRKKEVNE